LDHNERSKWDQEELELLVTVEQLRAARGLLGWSQTELAARAGLSLPTVKRLEGGFGPRVSDEARMKLQRAIEAAGIDFIDENGGGLGVRFRTKRRRK
jgi:transcriptional regulator with XRE-family HTH domain